MRSGSDFRRNNSARNFCQAQDLVADSATRLCGNRRKAFGDGRTDNKKGTRRELGSCGDGESRHEFRPFAWMRNRTTIRVCRTDRNRSHPFADTAKGWGTHSVVRDRWGTRPKLPKIAKSKKQNLVFGKNSLDQQFKGRSAAILRTRSQLLTSFRAAQDDRSWLTSSEEALSKMTES